MTRLPTVFFAHGSPFLGRDAARGNELAELVADLPQRPRGIVAFTPHVRAERITLAARGIARLSFPRRFHAAAEGLRYAPPPAESLAVRVRGLLASTREELSTEDHAGFNHTLWMGFIHLFPQADIPLVEIAMPFVGPARLFALGQALAPLREEGALVVSSGTLTHNLATLGLEHTPAWAREFDHWIAEALAAGAVDAVLDWRRKAPAAAIAHPDDGGHFNVMLCAYGAAGGDAVRARSLHAGFEAGSFSTRDYVFA